ncbi:hypothetical protein KB559_10890 [Paenibacillus sp. Marseille-P2973]|uniref:hypothetical protein n=1 Tax=Paenibacillus sp. Marseille-P2973 TaxID=1871032 RepID=UPI001B35EE39|nr:hypothetical protein [Paenibacillus sp. Marseille-P2973]MBQ4899343.1 hypothetical protein [Paenibacillus sp. Marseille-P2973]
MCKHGTTKPVKLNTPRMVSGNQVVDVDACIADEIQELNDMGIITIGSCCGHGADGEIPHVLIEEESVTIANRLGYQFEPYLHGKNDYRGVYIVKLKGENV